MSGRGWLFGPMASAGILALAAALAGCGGESARQPAEPVRYEIAVGSTGYEPATVNAKPGQEVVLVFTRTTDQTCGTEVVIPSENDRTVPLPLNQPTEVRITPTKKGTIAFTCGMKMFDGKIVVD